MSPRLALLLLLGVTAPAYAQSSVAEQLFNEAVALSEAGKFADACARFEESLARDPRQLGAMLQLGRCNEEQGKVSTALRYYRSAREQAIEAGKDVSRQQAEQMIAVLEPQIPRLRFVRERDGYPGEKVVFDRVVVSVTEQLTPDPGEHTVTLTAPGRIPYETKVTIGTQQRLDVKLPALDVPKDKVTTRERSSLRPIGKTMAIAGLSVSVVGAGLALLFKRDYDSLFEGDEPHCGLYPDIGGKVACDDYGVSVAERDRKVMTFGIVTASVGLAAAITGIIMWQLAPRERSTTTIVPTLGDGGPSVTIQRTVSW